MANYDPAQVARNKEIINKIAVAYSSGNPDALDEVVAKDIRINTPDPMVEGAGIELFKNQIRIYHDAFPDMSVTIDKIVADNDSVAAWYTIEGTQTGPLPEIPATNRKVKLNAVDFYSIRDGKAVEYWGLYDGMKMMEQLDLMPSGTAHN